MERRDFVKIAGVAGVTAAGWSGFARLEGVAPLPKPNIVTMEINGLIEGDHWAVYNRITGELLAGGTAENTSAEAEIEVVEEIPVMLAIKAPGEEGEILL